MNNLGLCWEQKRVGLTVVILLCRDTVGNDPAVRQREDVGMEGLQKRLLYLIIYSYEALGRCAQWWSLRKITIAVIMWVTLGYGPEDGISAGCCGKYITNLEDWV